MADDTPLTFFHSPNTRSTGVLFLLEELGAPYDLKVLNMKAGEQRGADYLAINPMGKVPAIVHRGELVSEQAALYAYLADEFPAASLAPKIGDRLRGPHLRWLAFYGSCFEPAIVDRSQKHAPAPAAMSPYGDFDTTWTTITDQLERGDYLLGDRFQALDVLWGTALAWITMFRLVPEHPSVRAYIDRVCARPAGQRARAKDAEIAARLQ